MGGREWLVRSIMFVSSYLPLYILLLIYQWESIFNNIFSINLNVMPVGVFIFLLFGIGISFLSVFLLKHVTAGNTCRVQEVKRPDDKVMDYVFTYILPIVSLSIENPVTVWGNLLLFLLLWYLYVRLNLLFINPLWVICGYTSYEYLNGHLITDMRFDEIKNREELEGVFLANGVFLAHRKENPIK